jgi:hypothetical protein
VRGVGAVRQRLPARRPRRLHVRPGRHERAHRRSRQVQPYAAATERSSAHPTSGAGTSIVSATGPGKASCGPR